MECIAVMKYRIEFIAVSPSIAVSIFFYSFAPANFIIFGKPTFPKF